MAPPPKSHSIRSGSAFLSFQVTAALKGTSVPTSTGTLPIGADDLADRHLGAGLCSAFDGRRGGGGGEL
jgi:hypothetical protein